jgi:hypothetical protein
MAGCFPMNGYLPPDQRDAEPRDAGSNPAGHRPELERQALEHFRQAAKEQREQQEWMNVTQEANRWVGDLSRTQADLYQAQEELRTLRALKDALDFEQQRSSGWTPPTSNSRENGTPCSSLTRLEVERASAKASLAAQELVIGYMLQRLGVT